MNIYSGSIAMKSIVTNAITKGSTSQDVANADSIEQAEKLQAEIELEGETKDD